MIDPYPDLESQLGSVSVDFRLGTTFMVFEHFAFQALYRSPQSGVDRRRDADDRGAAR